MAIPHITDDDDQARSKINAAIDQANLVGSKAASVSLAAQIPAPPRPGEAGDYFTAQLDGSASAAPPISPDLKMQSNDGFVVALVGPGVIAPRAVIRVEPGRLYQARFVLRRTVDPEAPADGVVRLGLRWLGSDKSGVSTGVFADLMDLEVSNGRVEFAFRFALNPADDVDLVAPSAAVYARPFLRTYGYGTTQSEVIEVDDLSSGVVFSPDLSDLRNQVAGLTQRLSDALDRIAQLESV